MSIFPKKKKWRFLLGAIIIAVIAIGSVKILSQIHFIRQ